MVLAGAVILALVVLACVALDQAARVFLRPGRRPVGRTPDAHGMTWTEHLVPDDPALTVWEVEGEAAEGPAVILIHGWGANQAVVLPLAQAVLPVASRIFSFDVRLHGLSDDAPMVSLRHFRDDSLRVWELVQERLRDSGRPDHPTILVGHSMGGAAAVLVAEKAPAAGICLIASPCDVYGVVARYLQEKGVPGNLTMRVLRPFINRRIGLPPRTLDPRLVVPGLTCPVLIIQPELDQRVPPSEGRQYAALSGGQLEIIEGAGHTDVVTARRTGEVLRAVATSLKPGGLAGE